ncbi:MAG: hypothetical protein GTN97_00900 [Nitrosopumilaceae archaeon]|nr:hypothetical protein [Nitrosopumilaceae archaeon]NIP09334.1 hypothetical protein [Nitrosopumilaceae archaeon]NIS94488.1 hypothetical protein [Nitrosopumilaceae archaeon]
MNKLETMTIYKKFQDEFGLEEAAIINAENMHLELLEKNPFKYESFYLLAAVCLYSISQSGPNSVSLEDIERISHIKKDEIEKCYNLVLDIE